ncbi:Plant self-incompatibility S1 [Arabidopsis thaliana x Arabidopsis arenosa]|uniref:S-protein homolog n=1 Tax=Arabidopsis thaliana x Arabidopsis arenosa TaxID=1240361 RepID=A0A8T2ARE2_9BRAS|nr:Plant self-incompatibility S1 [Arabidopsis thaliana x Arabidopsis arenosa]
MKLVFSFLFFILVLCFGSNQDKCHKNTVVFRNNLFVSHSTLKVHCKSRNDDLGEHFVKFQDPAYNFSFHDHLALTTIFKCNLWKGARLEYHRNFTAYEGAPIYRCGALYTWDIRDDAIYLAKNDKPEQLMYSWIKG